MTFCLGCKFTACAGEGCPDYPNRPMEQSSAAPSININVSVLPDELRRYGTSNEQPVATLDRIRELKQQVAALTEALELTYAVLRDKYCGKLACDDCLTGQVTRMFTPRCAYRHGVKAANAALSSTPASVAQQAEDARVGRLLAERIKAWRARLSEDEGCMQVYGENVMCRELEEIIVQAKVDTNGSPIMPRNIPTDCAKPIRKIYISSSWKNREQVRVAADVLRALGYEVFDFTDPACRKAPIMPPEAFPEEFDPDLHLSYGHYLDVPRRRAAVEENAEAVADSDLVMLLLACGVDATADWALGVGMGKKSIVVGHPAKGERSPVHLWADARVETLEEAIAWLRSQAKEGENRG